MDGKHCSLARMMRPPCVASGTGQRISAPESAGSVGAPDTYGSELAEWDFWTLVALTDGDCVLVVAGVGQSVGVSAGLDDVGAEGEAVDDCGAQPWVGEGLGPAGE